VYLLIFSDLWRGGNNKIVSYK